MPTYAFEKITAADATGFLASKDTLTFDPKASPSALGVSVTYNPDGGATLSTTGGYVTFGSGVLGLTATFADGGKLFIGGDGNDLTAGSAAGDNLYGGSGADTLQGLSGADLLSGAAGADSLSGGPGSDTLDGGAGADTLDGGDGFDVLSFASATGPVQVSLADSTQVGEGSDRFVNFEGLAGGRFDDQLTGDAGANLLIGGAGNDTILGGAGDDSLEGGRGDDLLDGGPGADTLVFSTATSGVNANFFTQHILSFDGNLGQDTISGIENALGTPFDDVFVGDGVANRFVGGDGADTLNGGGGNDTLDGGAGADILSGGDGQDDMIGGAGVDTMTGGGDFDIYEFSAGDSPMLGLVTELDRINDFGGDILVFHGGATPTAQNYIEFSVPVGDPRIEAMDRYSKGYEYIVMQVGGNVEVFAPKIGVAIILQNSSLDAIDVINIRTELPTIAPPLGATLGDDSLPGSGNETVDGMAGADTIVEPFGVNYLRGGDGNDSIIGGTGFDDINGNQGNDTCVSGGGDDWVVGGKDNDSLVGSDGQNLVYGNIGSDTCDGGGGNDIVRGGQDNDSLMGGAGDDFISGDRGNDTEVGGAGADIFHTFGDAGIDRVLDFHVSEGDRVQLDPGTQYTVAQVGADTVINMTGGGQMILVGVAMNTLTGGWIFGA